MNKMSITEFRELIRVCFSLASSNLEQDDLEFTDLDPDKLDRYSQILYDISEDGHTLDAVVLAISSDTDVAEHLGVW